jgi:hypothetical protein
MFFYVARTAGGLAGVPEASLLPGMADRHSTTFDQVAVVLPAYDRGGFLAKRR